jgi:hypothetical protein
MHHSPLDHHNTQQPIQCPHPFIPNGPGDTGRAAGYGGVFPSTGYAYHIPYSSTVTGIINPQAQVFYPQNVPSQVIGHHEPWFHRGAPPDYNVWQAPNFYPGVQGYGGQSDHMSARRPWAHETGQKIPGKQLFS